MKKFLLSLIAGIFILTAFSFRLEVKEAFLKFTQPQLPAPQPVTDFVEPRPTPQPAPSPLPTPASIPATPKSSVPAQINLDVPFASQAPFNDWGVPFKEACEEAAIIMAHTFLVGEKLSQETMKQEILKMVEWEKKTFGYYEDTSAQEMARTLREYYGHTDIEVKFDFTKEDLMAALAQGYPVVIPAAGRMLGNPNFRSPGPFYHALTVKGYTSTHFITNDPGTRKGADYIYTHEVLMNAVHDFNKGDVLKGKKVMIVVKK